MPKVKLSIITINFNNKPGLEQTIRSVQAQNSDQIEYLIIDGNSTDGSRELIETNNEIVNYWVSEPDNGIYDAMNKGIKQATGDYLMFLNSGDYLLEHSTIQNCFDFIEKNPGAEIYYGDIFWVKD